MATVNNIMLWVCVCLGIGLDPKVSPAQTTPSCGSISTPRMA